MRSLPRNLLVIALAATMVFHTVSLTAADQTGDCLTGTLSCCCASVASSCCAEPAPAQEVCGCTPRQSEQTPAPNSGTSVLKQDNLARQQLVAICLLFSEGSNWQRDEFCHHMAAPVNQRLASLCRWLT